MKKAPQFLAGLAVLGVAVSGCGDDAGTGTNSGDLLETGEANAVFNQLFAIGFGGIASGPAPLTAPTAEPIPETSTQCPGGGSVTISGNVNGGATSATFDITETVSGCVITEGATTFTVNGDPNIRITGDLSFDATFQNIDMDMNMEGGFAYTADDGRAGSCAVDASISLTGTSASVTGHVCGHTVTLATGF